VPLTEETRARAREIVARYPEGRSRSALLPMLHLVQAEEGYVTADGVALCAEELGLTKAEVGAVATFYTMYKRRPVGDYLVSVCTNLACQLLGGDEVFARLSKQLGVRHDETTEDGTITLEHAECLAACDYAPVVTVNYEFYDNATPDSASELVSALQAGQRPMPTRGAPLCSFREIERQLAGFVDPRPEAVATGAGHPEPGRPIDSRGTEDTTGTDTGPSPTAGEYGVAGGVTERVLSNREAAATYAEGGAATGGVADITTEDAPARRRSRKRRSDEAETKGAAQRSSNNMAGTAADSATEPAEPREGKDA
jgi:NADH-quinone oxidoreductase subunit E